MQLFYHSSSALSLSLIKIWLLLPKSLTRRYFLGYGTIWIRIFCLLTLINCWDSWTHECLLARAQSYHHIMFWLTSFTTLIIFNFQNVNFGRSFYDFLSVYLWIKIKDEIFYRLKNSCIRKNLCWAQNKLLLSIFNKYLTILNCAKSYWIALKVSEFQW